MHHASETVGLNGVESSWTDDLHRIELQVELGDGFRLRFYLSHQRSENLLPGDGTWRWHHMVQQTNCGLSRAQASRAQASSFKLQGQTFSQGGSIRDIRTIFLNNMSSVITV